MSTFRARARLSAFNRSTVSEREFSGPAYSPLMDEASQWLTEKRAAAPTGRWGTVQLDMGDGNWTPPLYPDELRVGGVAWARPNAMQLDRALIRQKIAEAVSE